MSAMDRFRALWGGQSNLAEAPESVLGEWQKYSTESAPPTQSDRLMGQMEAGGEALAFILQKLVTPLESVTLSKALCRAANRTY